LHPVNFFLYFCNDAEGTDNAKPDDQSTGSSAFVESQSKLRGRTTLPPARLREPQMNCESELPLLVAHPGQPRRSARASAKKWRRCLASAAIATGQGSFPGAAARPSGSPAAREATARFGGALKPRHPALRGGREPPPPTQPPQPASSRAGPGTPTHRAAPRRDRRSGRQCARATA
jgi:hypothetical protein